MYLIILFLSVESVRQASVTARSTNTVFMLFLLQNFIGTLSAIVYILLPVL